MNRYLQNWTCRILCVWASAGFVLAQDATQLLKTTAETYRGFKSYHFEGNTVVETKVGSNVSKSETAFVVAFQQPNQFRLEVIYPSAGNWVRVSDGKTVWKYRSITKELNKAAATDDDLRLLASSPLAAFSRIDEGATNASVVGSDTVTIDGKNFDCYVVQLEQPSTKTDAAQPLPTKLWIDKSGHLILRQIGGSASHGAGSTSTENTRTTTFTLAAVNQPVPDELFHLKSADRK